jgi:RNA polymerase sigma-70 factor (ECF subfamily)
MSYYNKLTDDELIVLLKEDELNAFREVYNRYWKKLYGFAYRRLKNPTLVEEILQDFFTKIWIKRQTVNIKSSLALFLFGSVKNEIFDFYRRESTRLSHLQSYKRSFEELDNSTEDYLNVADLENAITTQIQELPPKCRDVFRLSREQNKSNKEIAAFFGISEKTVENQITKALKRIKIGIGELGLLLLIYLNL